MIIYFNEIPRLILKLRYLNHSDDEIKQLLGLSYRTNLNKFIK